MAYTWDIKNRLSAVGGVGYAYDGDNLRIQKTMGGTLKVQYYYDGKTPILELDGNGNVLKRYNPGISVATGQDKRFFYAYNRHGDVADLTDTHGNLVQSYQYTAFGALTNGLTDKFNGSRYAGQFDVDSDDDTGLEYMGMRWYDSAMGRFISRDPIGYAGGDINLYRYCGNNPVNRVDQVGLISWQQFWDDVLNAGNVSAAVVLTVVVEVVIGIVTYGTGTIIDVAITTFVATLITELIDNNNPNHSSGGSGGVGGGGTSQQIIVGYPPIYMTPTPPPGNGGDIRRRGSVCS